MKKTISAVLSAAMLASGVVLPASAASDKTETITYKYDAGNWVHTREMEKLGRGLVAIKSGSDVYLSWRLLDSEDMYVGSSKENVTFNIYEGGTKIAENVNNTNYTVSGGNINAEYSVEPVYSNGTGKKESAIKNMTDNYFDIPVEKPDDVTLADGITYSYTINDASCGDLDGDGEYEIILKWDCHGQDNSNGGYTGNVLIDAYTLSGKKLWRVDLGQNIRAGAHYTQFLVYDFDGDGKAEMTCKTAPGSKDAGGKFVTKASKDSEIANISDEINNTDYTNSNGYILNGDEYLTIFDCDGKAVDTIYYPNQRVETHVWGDRHYNGQGQPESGGNRVDRFTATVAYMDGVKPYAVYMRGYYMRQNGGNSERQAACAVSFDGNRLECTHSFDTYDVNSYNDSRYGGKANSSSYRADGSYKGVDGYVSGNERFVGEGNHNCSTADVDNDGKDEVMTGALCYEFKDDDTLGVKWCTFLEHGDALHIGDYDPTHEGFEFFNVQEDSGPNSLGGSEVAIGYGMTVVDPGVNSINTTDSAYDDLIMFRESASGDTARGVMANIGMGGYYQIWSSKNTKLYMSNGGRTYNAGNKTGLAQNFRIFWDGDLYDELLDGARSFDDKTEKETDTTTFDASVTSWAGSYMRNIFTTNGCRLSNGTKANPALTADLFGDWREEIVMRKADNSGLRVYSTTTPTDYKIKTLMQDPVYRSGVAAEQTAYNQPPHVGIYMADETFTPAAKTIEILSLPIKTEYYKGESLNSDGLTLTVTYTDDSTQQLTEGYQLSGYDANTLGKQTVTVTYKNKTASFEVNVLPLDISNINGNYITGSTSSVSQNIQIGSLTGDFAIEHTLTINSMPANGSTGSNSTDGFMMRFTPDGAVGGGWYIYDNNGSASIIWKTTSTSTIAQSLTLGETYTVRYAFKNVGDGTGAHVDMTITDSEGNQVGFGSNLDLRNMTSNNRRPATLSAPLVSVDIYNQAKAGSQSSVTIANAHLGNIIAVDTAQRTATVYIPSDEIKLYAAKYNGGALSNIQQLTVDEENYGKSTVVNLEFVPDKIFCWKNMQPVEIWENK